ncbi:Protein STRUBBELIG-RECEPTOR FAMILY 6 [Hibiscus syriacus]|uniref:Protein STRUBBELIG-RECEPTOR FAMILY 6 n=1 Tax=Hibiscus syriacus TaxID=106335 RepID=A0A6A3C6X6_HIBSY|nr:Protein STRUBBELIG-RECEPTOR FAMILY 6 [Hibiscus syriacus]
MVKNWRKALIFVLFTVCILGFKPGFVDGETDQGDASALGVMYSALNSPQQLTGWTASNGDPCGQSWKGVTCSNKRVTEIKLSNLGLSGTMGYSLQSLTSLKELDLSHNNLAGDIPYNIPPNLQRLNLESNQFTGGVPYSISQMPSLQYLNLAHNQLQNALSDMFGSLSSLSTLDLSFNSMTGSLPESFRILPFTGWVPDQLKSINLKTDGNSWSSGPAPPPPPGTPATRNTRKHKSGSNGSTSDGGSSSSGIGGGAIAGIVISIFIVGAIAAFFLVKRRSRRSSSDIEKLDNLPFAPLASNEVQEIKSMKSSSLFDSQALDTPLSINLRPPPVDRHKSFDEEFNKKPIVVKKSVPPPTNVKSYSIADLQMATGSFSVENLLGEGSFGRVYRAQFSDGKVLAVKKIDSSALSSGMSDDFMEMVSNISQLHHTNVTELVGYCSEHGQHLLVYDFHKNGSLQDFIYQMNIKSTNILLDAELNPHLSDSGLATFIPNADEVLNRDNAGSGYSAPEVTMSGQYSLKSDVYGFGVVMLEVLTGRKPFDSSRPRLEQSLVRWATPQLHDIDALSKMPEPEFRPPMSEVVEALVQLVQRANMSKRTTGTDQGASPRTNHPDDTHDYM